MKFASFKEYFASKWKAMLLMNLLSIICVCMLSNKTLYLHIPNFERKVFQKGTQNTEGLMGTSGTVTMQSRLHRHLGLRKTNFSLTTGNYVTPVNQSTKTDKIANIPGTKNMDGQMQLHVQPTVNKTEITPTKLQPRDHKLLISTNETCANMRQYANNSSEDYKNVFDFSRDLFLLMTVKSDCRSRDRRRAIRSSWGNETWIYDNLGVKVKLVFLLGSCISKKDDIRLVSESLAYSDILQWDFPDTFQHLTLKEYLFLQWFTKHCQEVPFLYQGDDDVLVNVENILHYLSSLPDGAEKTLWAGSLLKNSPRITDPKSKYFVSKDLFLGKVYPPYVSGGGNVMSGHVAVRFFRESLRTPMIPIDDAFLGILAKSIGVEPVNVDGFESWGMDDPSPENLASIKTYHRVSPKKMISMWNSMIAVKATGKELMT